MVNKIDKEVLLAFIEEAKSYLPIMLDSIENFKKDHSKTADLEEARRLFHLIKGSTSMIGYSSLSHIAYFAEDILDEVSNGRIKLNQTLATLLQQTIFQIEVYLDGIVTNNLDEKQIFLEVFKCFRRFKNLPQELDEIEFEKLFINNLVITNNEEIPSIDDFTEENEYVDFNTSSVTSANFSNNNTQINPELLEVFFEEAEEHIQNISKFILALEEEPNQRELLQELRRRVHTLKGATGTMGYSSLSHLLHKAEDLLDLIYENHLALSPNALNTLLNTSLFLEETFHQNNNDNTDEKIEQLYNTYSKLIDELPVSNIQIETLVEAADTHQVKSFETSDLSISGEEVEKASAISEALQGKSNNIRVAIERIDELIKLSSETIVNRSGFEQYFRNFMRDIDELNLGIGRLQRVIGRLEKEYEASALGKGMVAFSGINPKDNRPNFQKSFYGFDELEFDRYTEFHIIIRELSETLGDMNSISNELNSTAADFDGYLTASGRLNGEMQDKLMQLRMFPLSTIAPRLLRTIKVTAQTQGKKVSLIFEGEKVEMDKMVLEELADPLLHILRNAVDHGIEPPALRLALGKPANGEIKIKAYYDSTQVALQISDDGKGIDPNSIRTTAINKGFISESEANNLTDKELFSFLFFPGFSTAQQISEISGRGVGLDVVKSVVAKIKGNITVDSQLGKGTTFTIRLPLTLAVIKVILVKSSEQTLAIPLSSVTRILRIEENQLQNIGQKVFLKLEEDIFPLHYLSDLLKLGQKTSESFERMPVLIVNLGTTSIALVVDQLLEAKEIVVKSIGSLLKKVYGVFGATLMGDGSVIMIINPNELIKDANVNRQFNLRAIEKQLSNSTIKAKKLNVLVVDDSISLRRTVSDFIKRMGWSPIEAKDGLEALEILQSTSIRPDVILLDIEMPRMDGYELASVLRRNESYQHTPIIMLTSRSEEKHRRKAFESGATEYLVKPYQEEVLVDLITKLSFGNS